jgi:hypothetical protein
VPRPSVSGRVREQGKELALPSLAGPGARWFPWVQARREAEAESARPSLPFARVSKKRGPQASPSSPTAR